MFCYQQYDTLKLQSYLLYLDAKFIDIFEFFLYIPFHSGGKESDLLSVHWHIWPPVAVQPDLMHGMALSLMMLVGSAVSRLHQLEATASSIVAQVGQADHKAALRASRSCGVSPEMKQKGWHSSPIRMLASRLCGPGFTAVNLHKLRLEASHQRAFATILRQLCDDLVTPLDYTQDVAARIYTNF